MNSKDIGNIGEAKTLCKFVELGIPVYIPFGDNNKSDLIAEFNGKLNKIQVKTAEKIEDGAVCFRTKATTRNSKSYKDSFYTKDEIDYFALYSMAVDKIFLVPIEDVSSGFFTIRLNKPKNNQSKGVHFMNDYLIDNIFTAFN